MMVLEFLVWRSIIPSLYWKIIKIPLWYRNLYIRGMWLTVGVLLISYGMNANNRVFVWLG